MENGEILLKILKSEDRTEVEELKLQLLRNRVVELIQDLLRLELCAEERGLLSVGIQTIESLQSDKLSRLTSLFTVENMDVNTLKTKFAACFGVTDKSTFAMEILENIFRRLNDAEEKLVCEYFEEFRKIHDL